MFQHQGEIFKRFIKNKVSYVQQALQVLDALNFIIRFKSLKILNYKCSPVQAHIAVITTAYSNGPLVPSCLYFLGCVYKHL